MDDSPAGNSFLILSMNPKNNSSTIRGTVGKSDVFLAGFHGHLPHYEMHEPATRLLFSYIR
jgi:hypothetical protein